MKWIFFVFSLGLSSGTAHALPCGKNLLAFNLYEDLIDGRIVEKFSVFPPEDWSDASAFDGLIIPHTEDFKNAKLVVQLRRSRKGAPVKTAQSDLSVWPRDPAFMLAKDFEPGEFLNGQRGFFTLKLVQKDKTLCDDTHAIVQEGHAL